MDEEQEFIFHGSISIAESLLNPLCDGGNRSVDEMNKSFLSLALIIVTVSG